jgi:Uma2 family endonuclease
MASALREPMRLEDFLAWEERQEVKYEFDGVQPVAMTGGTLAHSFIQRNLAIATGGRLRGRPCAYSVNDVKIEVAGSIRYPDGFVFCSPLPRNATVVRDPVVIFEVLGPSTSGTDRIVKNQEYAATPSVRRYVILERDRIAATVFAREGDQWIGHVPRDDATLAMPEIGVSLPLAELYEGVDLTPGALSGDAADADGRD